MFFVIKNVIKIFYVATSDMFVQVTCLYNQISGGARGVWGGTGHL